MLPKIVGTIVCSTPSIHNLYPVFVPSIPFCEVITKRLPTPTTGAPTELKFENETTSLFVKLEKANIMFYLTDKPKQEPEWADEINNPKEEM